MSFKQKTTVATTVTFSAILLFVILRVLQMMNGGTFTSENVFRLWIIVIIAGIGATVLVIILTHIVGAVIQSIENGGEEPEIDDTEDERDRLIDLRGTKVTYSVYSLGVFFSMLAFVLGQSALVMFTLLIIFGILAQVLGDITRLCLYGGRASLG